ncbi:MAG: hypothetical protein KDA32_12550 [Phycisphaerales bacterium]|nr:hypothetical protein [Phycisphaerales bacterium]
MALGQLILYLLSLCGLMAPVILIAVWGRSGRQSRVPRYVGHDDSVDLDDDDSIDFDDDDVRRRFGRAPMPACRNCRNALRDRDQRFCGICGARL